MADNFNLAKFLRNNRLLNESIGGYRDIKPMREAESITDNEFKKGDLVRIKADQDYGNDEYMGVDQARFKDLKGQRLKVTGTHDGGKTVWINDVDSLPASYLELDDPKKNAPIRVTPDNEVGADDELGSSGWGMSEANEGDEEQAYFDYKRSGEDDIDDVDPLPSLSPKFNISQDDFFGRMMDLAHEEFMGISDIVSMTIDSLRHGGFDDRDILNFLATDFSLDEEVPVSSSGVGMEEAMIRYDSDMQEDGKTYIVDLGFKSFVCVYDADNEQFIPEDPSMQPISKYNDRIKGVQLYKKGRSPYSDISYGNKD